MEPYVNVQRSDLRWLFNASIELGLEPDSEDETQILERLSKVLDSDKDTDK